LNVNLKPMEKSEVEKVINKHFGDYPIEINITNIMVAKRAFRIREPELDSIFKTLRRNIDFFEKHKAAQHGLFNLFLYAIQAMGYQPEEKWDAYRVSIIKEYQQLLKEPIK
jgi:hypothetical protein